MSAIEELAVHAESSRAEGSSAWQRGLLPFMRWMLVGLTLFFFGASCSQLIYLNQKILNAPSLNIRTAVPMSAPLPGQTFQQTLEATRLQALVVLEADATRSQYQEADMLLAGRLWTTYLGFVTGMILALVGATYVLGKLEEQPSELKATSSGSGLSFKSASPGLMLACLGVILMLCTILTHNNIDVTHRSTYLSDSVQAAQAADIPAQGKSDNKPPVPIVPDKTKPRPRRRPSTSAQGHQAPDIRPYLLRLRVLQKG